MLPMRLCTLWFGRGTVGALCGGWCHGVVKGLGGVVGAGRSDLAVTVWHAWHVGDS